MKKASALWIFGLVTMLLLGCTSEKGDFSKAEKADTIAAYENFILDVQGFYLTS